MNLCRVTAAPPVSVVVFMRSIDRCFASANYMRNPIGLNKVFNEVYITITIIYSIRNNMSYSYILDS